MVQQSKAGGGQGSTNPVFVISSEDDILRIGDFDAVSRFFPIIIPMFLVSLELGSIFLLI